MRGFLESNGPWDQLVRYNNISIKALQDEQVVKLADDLTVRPFRVPHRQENSEVVGYRMHVQRKGYRNRKLTKREKQGNHTRSKTRARVKHVFGVQAQKAGDLIVRAIGILRARAVIGLRNLFYNIDRYAMLCVTSG